MRRGIGGGRTRRWGLREVCIKMTRERKLEVLVIVEELRPDAVDGFLRRNGLSKEMIERWRREREAGKLRLCGREDTTHKRLDIMSRRVAQLEQENKNLQNRLKQASVILEFHKNLSELMGISAEDDVKKTASD